VFKDRIREEFDRWCLVGMFHGDIFGFTQSFPIWLLDFIFVRTATPCWHRLQRCICFLAPPLYVNTPLRMYSRKKGVARVPA
jgi:hypothetical protein